MTATDAEPRAVPRLAVWGVTILGVLLGTLMALGGTALAVLIDRAGIASIVRSGEVQVDGLSDAQAIDLLVALSWWGGVGLVVTGALFVLASVAYLLYERRLHRSGIEKPTTAVSLALFGAFVTIFTSFLPGSPLLGGGLAGYFGGGARFTGAKVGALSGVFSLVPMALLGGAVAAGFAVGAPASGPFGGPAFLLLIVGGSALVSVLVTVALAAGGGALGSYVAADRRGA